MIKIFNCLKRQVKVKCICLPRYVDQFELSKNSIRTEATFTLNQNETSKRTKWDPNWDKAAPSEGQPLPTATRHIFLVRHGQYQVTQKTELQRELTQIGELQSNTTGLYLKELGHKYTDITSSDLTRSVATANIIGNSLPSKIPRIRSGLLRECHMIPPDPEISDFAKRIGRHHPFARLPMVEAGFRKMFYRALPKQKEDTYHIVVGHLNVFCYFIARIFCDLLSRNKRYFHISNVFRRDDNSCDQWQLPILETITPDWDYNWDQKEISLDSDDVRFITLINHCEHKDGKLTNKGLSQALKVAERLNYLDNALTSIVHCGSPRTLQTAEVIREALKLDVPLSECPILKAVEKVTLDTVSSTPVPPNLFYRNESLVEAAFRKHFYRPDPEHCTAMELFVCHPNIINYFICRSLQLSTQAWVRLNPPHGSMTVLSISGYSIYLDSFGDVGHLKLDSMTNVL